MVSKEENHYIWPWIEFLCPRAVKNLLDLSEKHAAEELLLLLLALMQKQKWKNWGDKKGESGAMIGGTSIYFIYRNEIVGLNRPSDPCSGFWSLWKKLLVL